jgi:hypothetical protein
LESDAFAGANDGSFGAHAIERYRDLERVARRNSISNDMDSISPKMEKGQYCLKDANVRLT